jgi:BNR repeat-like domain/Secretion system C-terminal sorting domain
MKTFSILIAVLTLSINIFSQIEDIAYLPVQNSADIYNESAPVMLSEDEVIIFYVNSTQDTIFFTISRDSGNNWETPRAVITDELDILQLYYHITALRSTSGRIFLAWAIKNEAMLIYSDDNGTTWSEPQVFISVGNPAFPRRINSLNFSQLDDGRILIGFDVIKRTIFFKQSSDDGVTWSDEPTEVYSSSFMVSGLNVVNPTGENLLAVFESNLGSSMGIYKLISTDNGLTWSDTIRIVNTELNETRPKVVKRSDGSLLLSFVREDSTKIPNYSQNDIYYMISSDGGETWQEEKRFTKYIGNDDLINISHFNGKTFISFASERFTNNPQISYGILEETVESYTPPKVINSGLIDDGEDETVPTDITYRATIIDDGQVAGAEVEIEDMLLSGDLFDDGMHDDLEANDNVWGNVFPFNLPRNFDTYEMTANKILLPFNNKGVIADVRFFVNALTLTTSRDIENNENSAISTSGFERGFGGKYDEGLFLFSSGFFLSGYSNGELWSNAVASSSLLEDYLPGKVGSNPEDNLNVIYTVNKDDPPFGTSWQKWKDAVSLGAEFYDGDGDGEYNPVDKNWNGTWDLNEDMPALIGDETSWCVYNDAVPDSSRRWESEPQGIEIKQTLFATNNPELEEVIFIKYSILNTGLVNDVMDSVYFGVWEDADVGDYSDDVVGCDTTLNSGFYYNSTPDAIYGDNQPSFFTSILQGPIIQTNSLNDSAKVNYGELIGSELITGSRNLDISAHTFQIGGDPTVRDPGNIFEARNYLEGKLREGVFPDPCSFPYCEVKGSESCNEVDPHFWASGDPVTDIGWIGIFNNELRNIVSTGPFKLEKNKPQEIIIAYVMGRGTDFFNSITVARENVRRAITEYQNNFTSMTYSPPPASNPVTDYVLYHNYPNPFNPTTTIRYEIPLDGVVTIDIYDILGQKVGTILNEFQKADRYEINFNAVGLASGVYIYRMKVNDFIESKKMLLLK